MMKQEPILPSIHISVVKVPPKQMLPSLREYQSDNIIKGALIALLLYGFFIFVVLWWMNVPIQQNPLSSTIEVTFESPIVLPIPAEVPALSEDTSNENKIPSLEPLDTSEPLPKTDLSGILPIVKPQTSQQQKKKFPSKASINPEKSVSVGQVSSINNNQKAQQETNMSIQATKPAHKTLSIAQRCTALTKNYPMAARRRHEEGIVHINYQVLPDGKIQQVEVIESSGFSDLDHAAEQAVQSMKCQTAPEQSVIKTSISVNFSLNKNN